MLIYSIVLTDHCSFPCFILEPLILARFHIFFFHYMTGFQAILDDKEIESSHVQNLTT
jgi:hypothetical protein